MAPEPTSIPSFSRRRKWRIGFNVLVVTVAVFAVTVMINYLSSQIFHRFYFSSQTRLQLSSRTQNLLHSVTNQVQITVYCNKDADYFGDLAGLLKEYTAANSKIAVRYIDYNREPGAAEEFNRNFQSGSSTNKNVIVFECEGRKKTILGDALVQNQLVPEASEDPNVRAYRKKPINFLGEMLFTGALIGVTNPKPLKVYFLEGHGEHRVSQSEDPLSYSKFAFVLSQNCVEIERLSLLGTNTVPDDCSLLVIAGPKDTLPAVELGRIEKYLEEGGRLLVLVNFLTADRLTGLEQILVKWGVKITGDVVKDPDYSSPPDNLDVFVVMYRVNHPLVNALVASRLQMIQPREIEAPQVLSQPETGLKAEEIAYSGPRSFLVPVNMRNRPGSKPLIVAVEKSAAKGVAAERGATRILVVGDSFFLGNKYIESAANRDFANQAVWWLLYRPLLLEGVGPKRIDEYKLGVTTLELQTIELILLLGIPGGVMTLGGLVWLRRRK